ncbi:MAG: DUF4318 domain-containing protein [Clostridium sp.]
MFKKGFLIELNDIPKTDDDICIEVAKYCGQNNFTFEFIKRTSPITAIIDGNKYEVTKKFQKVRLMNCWILSCREVE